jgi:hypothetical protein
MSIQTSNSSTENSSSCNSNAVQNSSTGTELIPHFQQGGRYFLEDPDSGETVNVSRLTAYAKFGEEIYSRDAHHEIPLLKVDAPRFLGALTRQEHAEYHGEEPDPVEVEGFPLLRAGL